MEAVIKLAQQYWFEKKQPQRKKFIARRLSFHGNTIATLGLAFHPARRAPYEAILDHDNFFHVSPAYYKRFGKQGESEEEYVQRLVKELEDKILELGPETVAGFVAETVVGAATGAVPAPKGYFKAVREVCDKYDVLFILDEVMSGMGRKCLRLIVCRLASCSLWSQKVWVPYMRGRVLGTIRLRISKLSRKAWEGGLSSAFSSATRADIERSYATIGGVLMSEKVVDGIRDKGGFWKHGHTYQVSFFSGTLFGFPSREL